MKTIINYIILFVLLFFAYNYIYDYIHDKPNSNTSSNIVTPLQNNQSVSVTHDNSNSQIYVQHHTSSGTVTTDSHFIPVETHYNVTYSSQTNTVEINYKDKGFCLAPNASIGYTDNFLLGLGLRFFYWNKFGSYVCVMHDFSTGIGLDYRLYNYRMKNVAVGLSFVPINNHGYNFRFNINLYFN